ncbi:hypothetical protein SAMN04487765_1638 [Tenacibaculum sp. MAR_2010_89]|nr:hypothetical protein SAMN04487765_1638 [Tenacibaculum sp. MAR_2010_89]
MLINIDFYYISRDDIKKQEFFYEEFLFMRGENQFL